jgi:DNA-binding NarL/FixJ family response regulator
MGSSTHRPVRLAIVSDFELVVAGVMHMLARYSERVVVVEQGSRSWTSTPVDIILCDSVARAAGDGPCPSYSADPPARLVHFSWAADITAGGPPAQGATDQLSKRLTALELVEAVEAICARNPVSHPDLAPSVDAGTREGLVRTAGLTSREVEVLALIGAGLSNQEIADLAYLSINSVKTYIRTAYRKVGVARRSQAVRWALEHGVAGSAMAPPQRLGVGLVTLDRHGHRVGPVSGTAHGSSDRAGATGGQ